MTRKNPYSSVDVNVISVESLTRRRGGQAVAVGMDVVKGELVLCVVWIIKGVGNCSRPVRIL